MGRRHRNRDEARAHSLTCPISIQPSPCLGYNERRMAFWEPASGVTCCFYTVITTLDTCQKQKSDNRGVAGRKLLFLLSFTFLGVLVSRNGTQISLIYRSLLIISAHRYHQYQFLVPVGQSIH